MIENVLAVTCVACGLWSFLQAVFVLPRTRRRPGPDFLYLAVVTLGVFAFALAITIWERSA